jgi:hypothetical protein
MLALAMNDRVALNHASTSGDHRAGPGIADARVQRLHACSESMYCSKLVRAPVAVLRMQMQQRVGVMCASNMSPQNSAPSPRVDETQVIGLFPAWPARATLRHRTRASRSRAAFSSAKGSASTAPSAGRG